jgi:thioredoxin reductase
VRNGIIEQLGVQLDQRGNVATGADRMSSVPGVFVAAMLRAMPATVPVAARGSPAPGFWFHTPGVWRFGWD